MSRLFLLKSPSSIFNHSIDDCLLSFLFWILTDNLIPNSLSNTNIIITQGSRLQTAEEESLFACSKQGVWSISVTSLPSNLCRPVINIHCLHVQISSPGYRPSLPRDTEIRIWCLNLLGVLTIDISVSDSKIHNIPRSFHLSINNPSLAASRVSLASSFSYSCVSWTSHWQMSITSPSPISILPSVICSLRCLQPPALTMPAFGIYFKWVSDIYRRMT